MAILDVRQLKKTYTTRFGMVQVEALRDVSFVVEDREFVAIMGESGSGKTTLLNILAALDKPTAGQVLLDGQAMSSISDQDLARFRRENLGFVFQDFNLLDTFSVKDNILLPLVLSGQVSVAEMELRVKPLAERLGIEPLLAKFPYEVSGGEKQRTAIARALITGPRLLLADEPTGALDSKASSSLLSLLTEVNRQGQTILMVTHSIKAASHAGRVLFIKDGSIFHQLYQGEDSKPAFYQRITDALTALSAANGGKGGPA